MGAGLSMSIDAPINEKYEDYPIDVVRNFTQLRMVL